MIDEQKNTTRAIGCQLSSNMQHKRHHIQTINTTEHNIHFTIAPEYIKKHVIQIFTNDLKHLPKNCAHYRYM